MSIEDTYTIITETGEGYYKEKGSKFIAHAFPATSEEEAKNGIEDIKKKYHDARHHCYAYMVGADKSCFRSNDDGEPSGTAGKPILNQIISKDLTNVCLVVVRYFGGTKLGVSGLIRAYKTAAREALDQATIEERTINEIYALQFEYPLMNEVMRIMKEENLEQHNPRFELNCYFEINIRKNDADRIVKKFKQLYELKVDYLETK
ncbi:MAG: YigZ family protein [Bacteroidetes bacterium]|nr:YigZ family protein [Bacteroidota bacterium]MBU2464942.1 YigZ family protein [Bacteroidota bacterium]MBU2559163.1 YigZ family protein [Bacteroidota bacterium]